MNEELEGLYKVDIESRRKTDWDNSKQVKTVVEQDKKRRKRVEELLKSGELNDAADYHHAALIFQHGDGPEDYKKANGLAKKAMEMGEERSKWLYAATLDRWLLTTGNAQKYGTQFKQRENGDWELAQPIDKSVTDKERGKYNVPPLEEALSEYKKKYQMSRMVGTVLKKYRRRLFKLFSSLLFKLFSPLLSDKTIIKRRYLRRFGCMPDLVNPKLFNEKVMWRMLYDRRPIFQRISDKVEVRNYVEEKGLGRFLPKQYYATDDPSTINPETLPKSFVIKPNHACGLIHIVHDKKKANWKEIVKLCNEWLKIDYYKVARERQYKNIPRKIIVQEFLGQGKTIVPEYKFHSFDGEPKLILVSLGRYTTQHTEGWFDSSWKPKGQDTTMKRSVHIPKPDRLNELIKVARKFAAGFDYIRVDLYLLPKKIVFGELTVTASSGVGLRSKEVQEDLGATWKLNTKVRTK